MISADDLKAFVKPAADQGELALLVDLERGAVAHLERMTGRYFGLEREVVQTLKGTGTNALLLPGPVSEETAASIVVREGAFPGAEQDQLVDTSDDGYVLRDGVLVRKGGLLWWYGYEYEVAYTQGYKENAEPPDVRVAVMLLVQAVYQRRVEATGGRKQSETIGNYSYTNAAGMSEIAAAAATVPGVQGVVNTWRRILV